MAAHDEAKRITGLEQFAIDVDGRHVIFGFSVENNPRVLLQCSYETLGQIVNYLQHAASEAQQRRLRVDPLAEGAEGRETRSNLVVQMQFVADAQGRSAIVQCTTQTGITTDLQLSPEMIEGLLQKLPQLLQILKERQEAHRRQH
jgi:hypothetical protein